MVRWTPPGLDDRRDPRHTHDCDGYAEAYADEVWVWCPNGAGSYYVVRVLEPALDHPDFVAEILAASDPDRIGHEVSMAEANLVAYVGTYTGTEGQ